MRSIKIEAQKFCFTVASGGRLGTRRREWRSVGEEAEGGENRGGEDGGGGVVHRAGHAGGGVPPAADGEKRRASGWQRRRCAEPHWCRSSATDK